MHCFMRYYERKKKNPTKWNRSFMILRRTIRGRKVRDFVTIMNNQHNSQPNLKEQWKSSFIVLPQHSTPCTMDWMGLVLVCRNIRRLSCVIPPTRHHFLQAFYGKPGLWGIVWALILPVKSKQSSQSLKSREIC